MHVREEKRVGNVFRAEKFWLKKEFQMKSGKSNLKNLDKAFCKVQAIQQT
jgi:hypothetical protein